MLHKLLRNKRRYTAILLTFVMIFELVMSPVANANAAVVTQTVSEALVDNASEQETQERTTSEQAALEQPEAEQTDEVINTEIVGQQTQTEQQAEDTTEANSPAEKTGVKNSADKSEEVTESDDELIVLGNKDYHTDFKVTDQWDGIFEAEITITNDSEKTIEDWNFTCTFEHEITQIWNAFIYDHRGNVYQFKNSEWNADIKPGESVSFNFQAQWDNQTITEPKKFELSSEQIKLGEDNYNAEFTLTADWGDGFNGQITVTNNTDKVINDWVLSFDFDYTIDNVWDGKLIEHTDNHYVIQNSGYNGKLTKGQSAVIGLQGKPGKVKNGPYNYELFSYEDLKLELEAPLLVLDASEEYPTLKWNRVDGATTYTVKRKISEKGSYTVLASDLTDNTYTDMTTGAKGEYYYVVTADNKFTSSPDSNEVCYRNIAKTPTLYGQVKNESIELIWTEALGARSYTVYRSTQSGGPYYVLKDKLLKTEFVDDDNDPDEVYYYVVVAENERGSSENSNEVRLGVNEEREYTFDADADDDGDGLSNSDELIAGTDIFSKDTDNDGLNDKEELKYGTDPLEPDTDGDGIYDGAEVLLGLDPMSPDPMGEYQTDLTSDSGRANVSVTGDSNFIIAPFAVNDSDNVFVNSLDGIVGSAVEFTTGGFPVKSAEVTFYYTDEELESYGLAEEDLGIFKVNYETKQLEKLEGLVFDADKNYVSVLVAEAGTYLLGNSKMEIDLSNVDIVFAIDQSGSMRWNDPSYYRLLATKKFLERIDLDSYHAGILAFTGSYSVKHKLTSDGDALNKTLDGMRTNGGGTDLKEAILGSVRMFGNNSRRKIVILLTDGMGGNPVPSATDVCVKNNVVVNTIALGSDTDTKLLEQIATYTKGGYFYINNSSDMTKEDVEKQIDLIYEKLSKQLTLSEDADSEDLPEGKTSLEFSDLYSGIDSKEAQEWLTTASTNLLTGNYVYDETDIEMLGNGNNLTFTRTYNSLSADEDSILGKGYRTNLDTKVEKKESSEGEQVQIGKVDTGRLNVRTDAGTDKKKIGELSRGKTIKVLDTKEVDGKLWYKIKFKNKEGYVASWYIDGNGGYEVTFATGTKIFFTEDNKGKIRPNNSTDSIFEKTNNGYKLTNIDHSVVEYDSKGRLSSMYDKYGNEIEISYKNNKISKLEDVCGRYLKLSYDSNGLLSSIEDNAKRKVTYDYNSEKQLTKVKDVMGHTTKYEYHDKTGILSKVIDPNGHQVVRNDYDALGRIVRQYDGDNIIQYYIYDDEIDEKSEGVSARYMINGNGKESKTTFNQDLKPVIERDALGGQTKYKYEYYNGDDEEWVDITTKRDGNKVWEKYESYRKNHKVAMRETVTDPNKNKTITEYDKNGNPVKVTDAAGNSAVMEYDKYNNLIKETDKAGNVTSYEYDDDGIFLLSKTDAKENTTSYKYYKKSVINGIKLKGLLKEEKDQRNNITTYYYKDKYNNCTTIEAPLSNTTEMTYDAIGRKLTETDAVGNKTSYEYDNLGRITKVTDALDKSIDYTYDKAGNKTSETDKKGAKTSYDYDAKNQLIKVTDADKNVTSYTYDHVGNILKEKNPKGTTVYTYDAVNRKVKEKNALGAETAYSYDKAGNLTETIDALGRVTGYSYDKLNRMTELKEPLGKTTKYAYDKLGNVIKETDARGYYTETEYDRLGRVKKVTDKNGYVTTTDYDDVKGIITVTAPNEGVTVTELDALNREAKITDPLGHVTEKTYYDNGNLKEEKDALGRVTDYTYNALNLVETKNVKYTVKDELKDCITRYDYDANGNKIKETNAKSQVLQWKYDVLGRVIEETGADNTSRSYTYDAVGNVLTATDERGNTVTKTYDALSRVLTEEDALGNVTSFKYDAVGNLTEKINPLKSKTTYVYDELNRNTSIVDDNGNSEVMGYDVVGNNTSKQDRNGNITGFEYDKAGQLIKTINPDNSTISYEYDKLGNQTKVTDGKGNYTQTTYNVIGQKTEYIDQAGNKESYEYDKVGNLKKVIDRNGNETDYSYDDFDQLVKVTDALGNETKYTYDLAGNMTSRKDGEERSISYEYDVMNRLSMMTDGAGKTESYTYDAVGNMLTKKDRNGVTTHYEYDENNNLLVEKAGALEYNYTYDAVGNMLTMTDKTGVTEFAYDNLSRLVKKTFPTKQVVSYTYDAAGNQLTVQTGTNQVVTYTYDSMNRMETVEWSGGKTTYTYDANGNQTKAVHSNGMSSDYTFDARNLLTGLVNTNADGTKLTYSYKYDSEGLLIEKTEPKGKTGYAYNAIEQLTSMTEPDGRVTSYTYDRAGNRLTQSVVSSSSKTDITYKYDERNRLTETVENRDGTKVTTSYAYDDNGNQTKVVEKVNSTGKTLTDTYRYDELNQLIHISGRDGSTSDYTYYATGLRASKNVNGSTAVFIYDGKNILAELDKDGTRTNIYGSNMIATTGKDEVYYQYNNHGDVIRVSDRTGTLLNEYDYDAFGNVITESETVKNPYRYAGYYQDAESGLYYLRSRYYNPKTARFLTEDTASGKYTDPLSLNKYTYCHNQPVTGYDPDGHALHIVAGALIGGVIGGVMGAISAKKANPNASWKDVGKAALGGAVEGAIVGGVGAATGGLSLGYALGASAAAGAVGNTANQLISTGKVDGRKVLAASAACIVGTGVGKFAGALMNPTGSEAAAKAAAETVSGAGKQAAAKAGGSVISKTIKAAAQGGITGTAVGASADLTMQCAEYGAGLRDGIDGKELATSALLGGGLGVAGGAASQTKLGQEIAKSYQKGTEKLNGKIASFEKSIIKNSGGNVNIDNAASINPRTRLPRSNGHWEGKPGDSVWYSDIDAVNQITGGEGIPFKNGRPDFSKWSKGNLTFDEGVLNGSNKDFQRVYEVIKNNSDGAISSNNAARKYLRSCGLTPHHFSSTEIQLIPTDLHGNIPHVGAASDMRGGY